MQTLHQRKTYQMPDLYQIKTHRIKILTEFPSFFQQKFGIMKNFFKKNDFVGNISPRKTSAKENQLLHLMQQNINRWKILQH